MTERQSNEYQIMLGMLREEYQETYF